jgi:hypothetical protein
VNFFLNMLRRLGVPLVSPLQGHASPLARQKRPSLLHPVKGGPCRRCHTRGTDVGKEKSVYWMRVNRQLLAALYWEACSCWWLVGNKIICDSVAPCMLCDASPMGSTRPIKQRDVSGGPACMLLLISGAYMPFTSRTKCPHVRHCRIKLFSD